MRGWVTITLPHTAMINTIVNPGLYKIHMVMLRWQSNPVHPLNKNQRLCFSNRQKQDYHTDVDPDSGVTGPAQRKSEIGPKVHKYQDRKISKVEVTVGNTNDDS